MGKKSLIVLLFSFTYSLNSFSLSLDEKLEVAKKRCEPFKESDPVIYLSDYKSGQTAQDQDALYKKTYESEGRLPNRIGYYPESDEFIYKKGSADQGKFNNDYLKSLIAQVEKLIKLNYVKYIFYSDMGHSHLFIPIDYYEQHMRGQINRPAKAVEIALGSKKLKTLFHTAEHLQVRDPETKELYTDTYLQWRFYTRNPVLDLKANVEILTDFSGFGNTVRDYFPNQSGYKYYSGYYLSANKNGCFPFENKNGEIEYFDVSHDGPLYINDGDDGTVSYSHEDESDTDDNPFNF